jgi:acyl carrier protein
MEDLRSKVIKILDKYIFDKKVWDNAPENFRIIEDLKINSARIVDIVIDLEEIFDIEIDNKTLQKIKTIDNIVKLISEKQGK